MTILPDLLRDPNQHLVLLDPLSYTVLDEFNQPQQDGAAANSVPQDGRMQ